MERLLPPDLRPAASSPPLSLANRTGDKSIPSISALPEAWPAPPEEEWK
jgi:hypothetical protein